jgi:TolB protein
MATRLAFSPKGDEVVFARSVFSDTDLYIMDADGSDVRRLTDSRADDQSPDWQPILP